MKQSSQHALSVGCLGSGVLKRQHNKSVNTLVKKNWNWTKHQRQHLPGASVVDWCNTEHLCAHAPSVQPASVPACVKAGFLRTHSSDSPLCLWVSAYIIPTYTCYTHRLHLSMRMSLADFSARTMPAFEDFDRILMPISDTSHCVFISVLKCRPCIVAYCTSCLFLFYFIRTCVYFIATDICSFFARYHSFSVLSFIYSMFLCWNCRLRVCITFTLLHSNFLNGIIKVSS